MEMILKGIISSVEPGGIRVTFPERENTVSPPLKKASHLGTLFEGDKVVVIFFSNQMSDGIILAKY